MARLHGRISRRVVVVVALICVTIGLPLILLWPTWTKLQTHDSPDGRHSAELLRVDHIDRNYTVRVDGKRVYGSPDFAPRRDLPFRETLVWDNSGRVLVLEVAGRRIFGYDADKRAPLSDEALLAVEYPPDPPLWKYFFESEWPGIGRAQRPEGDRETEVNP